MHSRWFAILSLLLTSACAPYQFGTATLYPAGVRTIYIPVPRNDTYRHELGVQLADSLVREIELRTPYKVIGDTGADTVLVCKVSGETKNVLTETDSDDPRALDFGVTVQATWTDRLGNVLFQNSVLPTTPAATGFGVDSRFVPEAGQSVGTASVSVADNLAGQIVSQMQTRW